MGNKKIKSNTKEVTNARDKYIISNDVADDLHQQLYAHVAQANKGVKYTGAIDANTTNIKETINKIKQLAPFTVIPQPSYVEIDPEPTGTLWIWSRKLSRGDFETKILNLHYNTSVGVEHIKFPGYRFTKKLFKNPFLAKVKITGHYYSGWPYDATLKEKIKYNKHHRGTLIYDISRMKYPWKFWLSRCRRKSEKSTGTYGLYGDGISQWAFEAETIEL